MFKPGQELCEKNQRELKTDPRKIRLIEQHNDIWACRLLSGPALPGRDYYPNLFDSDEANSFISETELKDHYDPC